MISKDDLQFGSDDLQFRSDMEAYLCDQLKEQSALVDKLSELLKIQLRKNKKQQQLIDILEHQGGKEK